MEALKQVENLVSAKLALVKTLLGMIGLEARLAGLSVFPLLLNLCMVLIVLMTTWLFLSLLVGYGVLLLSNNVFLSLLLVFLLNAGVFMILSRSLASNIKNMSFEQTRNYFSQNTSVDHDHHEKRVNGANSNDE